MTDLAVNVSWGTAPINYFTFAYESERVQSTMRYKLQIDCAPCSGASYFGYPIYLEISLDGKVLDTHTLKTASPRQWSAALTYTTGWLEISKATGTVALVIRIYSGSGSNRDVKYSYSLPVIVTESAVSATDARIGRTCSIIISRASQALRHTLSYRFDGQDAFTVISEKTDQSVVAWTVPTDAYELIPNASSIICTIKCDTYSGDTLIGSTETYMIALADERECAPTVSATAVDTNDVTVAVTGDNRVIVKGYSNLSVTVSAAAKNGATITSVTVICGTRSVDATMGSASIAGADSVDVTIRARDSRGFTTAYSVSGLTLVEYTPCWVSPNISRPDPTGDSIVLAIVGSCYAGNIGQSTNQITLRWRSKIQGGEWSEWIAIPATVTDGKITAEETYSGFDYTSAYTAEVEVSDLIVSSAAKTVPIKRGIPVFDWGEGDFVFNVPVKGTCGTDGADLEIASGVIVRGANGLYIYGGGLNVVTGTADIRLHTTGNLKLNGADITLNDHKLSEILEALGLE